MKNFKLYINLLFAFCKIILEFDDFKSFLKRPELPGQGYGQVSRPLQSRINSEKSGRRINSRETTFLYLSTIAFSEKVSAEEMKDQLFPLLAILMLWYCEPLPESEPPTE